jgi:hypothetical protein
MVLAVLLPRAAGSCAWTSPQMEWHRDARTCRYASAVALPSIVPCLSSLSRRQTANGRWIQRCPAYRTSFCHPLPCAGPGVRCIVVLYAHRCWFLETDAQGQKTRASGYFCRCCMQQGANATCTQVCVPRFALGVLPECLSPLNVVVWPCMLQSQSCDCTPELTCARALSRSRTLSVRPRSVCSSHTALLVAGGASIRAHGADRTAGAGHPSIVRVQRGECTCAC